MDDTDICVCEHVRDEHGHDPKYPNADDCNIDGCDCLGFEFASEASGD